MYGVAARDLVYGHVGCPLLQNGGQAPVALKKEYMPRRGMETRQVLQCCSYVTYAVSSAGHTEHYPPLGHGTSLAHGGAGQTRELAVSRGTRGEDIPALSPHSDGRGKFCNIRGAPQGLGPQTGVATGATGAAGGAATAACTASPYQGPEYPEGLAAASAAGGIGTYGWCQHGVGWMLVPCGGMVTP